jgi:hypothetical protein
VPTEETELTLGIGVRLKIEVFVLPVILLDKPSYPLEDITLESFLVILLNGGGSSRGAFFFTTTGRGLEYRSTCLHIN